MDENLAAALSAFQGEMPTVVKSSRADVPTKSGGKYSYTYADLADVSQAALPLLAKHGLAFTACPRLAERGYELCGKLLHTSGESLEGALPIAGNSPQEMGSSITYMRRYLLGCMTGIVTDDDDDGRLAQAAKAQRPPPEPTRKMSRAKPAAADEPRTPQAVPPGVPETGEAITPAQVRKMAAMMNEQGLKDRDAALRFVSGVIGRTVESRNDLTKSEAHKILEALTAVEQVAPAPEPWDESA